MKKDTITIFSLVFVNPLMPAAQKRNEMLLLYLAASWGLPLGNSLNIMEHNARQDRSRLEFICFI